MYYTKKKGVGPFAHWVLVEKVTPKHKEEEVQLQDGLLMNAEGNPVSGATISIDKKGVMTIKGNGKTVSGVTHFEAWDDCFVFFNNEGKRGFASKSGNIILPSDKSSSITEIDVSTKLSVVKHLDKKSGKEYFTVVDNIFGLDLTPEKYTSYSFGDKDQHIPSSLLFLEKQNQTKAIVTEAGTFLTDSCLRYEKSSEHLFVLSYVHGDDQHKTVFEAYSPEAFTAFEPKIKHLEHDVQSFSTRYRELSTYNGKSTSVYTVAPYTTSPFNLKFTKHGKVRNIAPYYEDHSVYIQEVGDKKTILLNDGTPCSNHEIKDLTRIATKDAFSYVVEVDSFRGPRQGLVRKDDLSTLLSPKYDRVCYFGDNEKANLCAAIYGDTFAAYKLEMCTSTKYLPPMEILPMNQYFNPQLTKEDGKLYADDSYGSPVVVDFTQRDNAPVVESVADYGREKLGLPKSADMKEVEFVE